MKRLALTLLFFISYISHPVANEISDQIRAYPEQHQKAFWEKHLKDDAVPCGAVIRLMYQGTSPADESFWSVGCSDNNSYNVKVASGPTGEIMPLACAELDRILSVMVREATVKPKLVPSCWKDLDDSKNKVKLHASLATKCSRDLPKIDGALAIIAASNSTMKAACGCVATRFIAKMTSEPLNGPAGGQVLSQADTKIYIGAIDACVKQVAQKR